MELIKVVIVWARCINKIETRIATEIDLGIMLIASKTLRHAVSTERSRNQKQNVFYACVLGKSTCTCRVRNEADAFAMKRINKQNAHSTQKEEEGIEH
jgi:hypothetical protein